MVRGAHAFGWRWSMRQKIFCKRLPDLQLCQKWFNRVLWFIPLSFHSIAAVKWSDWNDLLKMAPKRTWFDGRWTSKTKSHETHINHSHSFSNVVCCADDCVYGECLTIYRYQQYVHCIRYTQWPNVKWESDNKQLWWTKVCKESTKERKKKKMYH